LFAGNAWFPAPAQVAQGRLVRLDAERPMRRRADSLVFRGLESLPARFD
jgi:hypothetical protein